MNKISITFVGSYIHVVMSLLSSTAKRLKLMPLKSLMCPELNETIIHQLLERFPKSICPYLYFIIYLNIIVDR